MTRQINLTDENYEKLNRLKDVLKLPKKRGAKKGVSFNAIIEELLSAYWNPAVRNLWLQDHFNLFVARLRNRDLSSDEIEQSLGMVRAKILKFGKREDPE